MPRRPVGFLWPPDWLCILAAKSRNDPEGGMSGGSGGGSEARPGAADPGGAGPGGAGA